MSCTACGATFPLFEFPVVATLAGPDRSSSTPVPERASTCPSCDAPVDA